MKDIATDLGLSVVTISKALRNHPDIPEETRARVLQRARERDYQPNLMARSLVTGRSNLVGLIVPGLLHPFFAEIARALSAALSGHGYSLIISSSEDDPANEKREIEQLMARRLDALVIASSGSGREVFERLDRLGQVYVLIDRGVQDLAANFVGTNDEAAGFIGTEHLIRQGCRRIAHIRGRDNSTGLRRLEGYRKALRHYGIPFSEKLVAGGRSVDVDSIRHGADAMSSLLDQNVVPDGLFAHNDPMAIGAIEVILERGLRIPEDIAVIGCGNLHYDGFLRVPLSSVDQRSAVIGQRTADVLLKIMESRVKSDPVSVIVDPAIVARASSMRSNSQANG